MMRLTQVGIGLTLFICELFAVYYTGGACNTARAFGPAAVTGFPHGSHWVVRETLCSLHAVADLAGQYWVGPGIGSLFAAAFYALLKQCVFGVTMGEGGAR